MSEVTIELTNRQRTYLERQFTLGADEDANSGSDAFGLMQKLRNAMGAEAYVPVVGDKVQVQETGFPERWFPGDDEAWTRTVLFASDNGVVTKDSNTEILVEWNLEGDDIRLDERNR